MAFQELEDLKKSLETIGCDSVTVMGKTYNKDGKWLKEPDKLIIGENLLSVSHHAGINSFFVGSDKMAEVQIPKKWLLTNLHDIIELSKQLPIDAKITRLGVEKQQIDWEVETNRPLTIRYDVESSLIWVGEETPSLKIGMITHLNQFEKAKDYIQGSELESLWSDNMKKWAMHVPSTEALNFEVTRRLTPHGEIQDFTVKGVSKNLHIVRYGNTSDIKLTAGVEPERDMDLLFKWFNTTGKTLITKIPTIAETAKSLNPKPYLVETKIPETEAPENEAELTI